MDVIYDPLPQGKYIRLLVEPERSVRDKIEAASTAPKFTKTWKMELRDNITMVTVSGSSMSCIPAAFSGFLLPFPIYVQLF
jgi:hypothetical protein